MLNLQYFAKKEVLLSVFISSCLFSSILQRSWKMWRWLYYWRQFIGSALYTDREYICKSSTHVNRPDGRQVWDVLTSHDTRQPLIKLIAGLAGNEVARCDAGRRGCRNNNKKFIPKPVVKVEKAIGRSRRLKSISLRATATTSNGNSNINSMQMLLVSFLDSWRQTLEHYRWRRFEF